MRLRRSRAATGLRLAALTAVAGLAACTEAEPLEPVGAEPLALSGGFPPWVAMESAVGNLIEDVWGSGAQDVFTVGLSGTIQHFDGTRWTVQPTGTTSSLRAVWGSGPADVWAVGNTGTSHHYESSDWTYQRVPTSETLRSVWGADGIVFTAGDGGALFRNEGSGWVAMERPTGTRMNAVHGRSPTDVFAAG